MAEVHFSVIFSKEIYHRRSLFHTLSSVYHRFAAQIYTDVGSVFTFQTISVSRAHITGMVSTPRVWEIIAMEAPVEVSAP